MKSPFIFLSSLLFLLLAFIPEYRLPATSFDKPMPGIIFKDTIISVTISITGDLMCHVPQYENSKKADGTYDFNPSFEFIKPYLHQADLTLGNLELTFAGTSIPYAGYPTFNIPDSYAGAIKNAGFNFVVTSNNHSMDTGEKGLLRTLDILNSLGIGHTGTFSSQADHDSVRILNLKGMKLGILNYTYGTNLALPSAEHKYMINVIDTAAMQRDIQMARKQGAELVLVFFHYGKEYVSDPIDAQKLAVSKAEEYGADLVIGGHPHVISPVGYYKTTNATLDSGFVAWSMGNFLSNQYHRYQDAGLILNLTLRKNITTHKYLKPTADFIPTWVYRGTDPRMKKHIIFPAELGFKDPLPVYIDSASRTKMKEAFGDTKALMGKYTDAVKVKSIH